MGRRFLPLILVAVACDSPPPARPDAASRAARVTAPPDASAVIEESAPPIAPGDVLVGPAAEKAIGELAPPPAAPTALELLITPTGVGPFRIGMPRNAALRGVPGKPHVVRLAGEPAVERADFFAAEGYRLLSLRIVAGRVVEISVTARDARAATDGDVRVGSTLEEAVAAHGDPRRAGPGWVLSDLPGVIFVVEGGKITRITVVGPEAD